MIFSFDQSRHNTNTRIVAQTSKPAQNKHSKQRQQQQQQLDNTESPMRALRTRAGRSGAQPELLKATLT